MDEKLKDSELVTIKDAGHMTPMEKPEAVNSAIEKFIIKY